MTDDQSNGYEAVADAFMTARSDIGTRTVREWSAALPSDARLLDIGAGSGMPITAALVEDGFRLHAIEPSPSLAAAFRERLPGVPLDEGPVQTSAFFGRRFDGIIAIGLIFLLSPEDQHLLIEKMAAALEPGGRLLFSAPHQTCGWEDLLTGRSSRSLGMDTYERLMTDVHLRPCGSLTDEGGNHYFTAEKPEVR